MRVVIAGGGVAALEAALALRALAAERVRVELVAPQRRFWYRPMATLEPFGRGEAREFPLIDVATAAGAVFTLGAVTGVSASRHIAHTSAGDISYDALLVACGAVPSTGVPGALTFRGPADTGRVRDALGEISRGEVRRLAFAVPWGATWTLPIYELALMTSAYVSAHGIEDITIAVVTPEREPLELFGPAGSDAIRGLLADAGIAVHTDVYPAEFVDGELHLVPRGSISADRVVALPRLRGPRIDGLPQTVHGFIPVDWHGRVPGLLDVFAAGDVTSSLVKQGGIAAQQADAAAEAIAAAAGADVTPQPFRPVLRGLLLTGGAPRYLRRDFAGVADEASTASPDPLWWPPAKIVGRYLAPFLAKLAGVDAPPTPEAPDAVTVEVELEPPDAERLIARQLEMAAQDEGDGGLAVGEVMSRDPLVVAPEDTLGEVAEKMRERDVGSAAVADYGRLVGILTSRDLLRAFAGRVHTSEARVREWMTAEPLAVSPDTAIAVAVTLMTEYGVHHLPVVEDDRPVGMLGLRQAARAARRSPAPGLGF